jgi:hypothetical protein
MILLEYRGGRLRMAFVEFGIACPAALARDRFGFFLTSLLPPLPMRCVVDRPPLAAVADGTKKDRRHGLTC